VANENIAASTCAPPGHRGQNVNSAPVSDALTWGCASGHVRRRGLPRMNGIARLVDGRGPAARSGFDGPRCSYSTRNRRCRIAVAGSLLLPGSGREHLSFFFPVMSPSGVWPCGLRERD
jgi:hypothetical protein